MTIFQRYVSIRFLWLFVIVAGILQFMFCMSVVLRGAFGGALNFQVLKSAVLAMPFFAPISFPLATVVVNYIMISSSRGEIRTMFSFGVSPFGVLRIFVLLAIFISSLTAIFAFQVSPLSFYYAHLGFVVPFERKAFEAGSISLAFESKKGDSLKNIAVHYKGSFILAKSGTLESKGRLIEAHLEDGKIFTHGTEVDFEKLNISVSLPYNPTPVKQQLFELLAGGTEKAKNELMLRTSLALSPIYLTLITLPFMFTKVCFLSFPLASLLIVSAQVKAMLLPSFLPDIALLLCGIVLFLALCRKGL